MTRAWIVTCFITAALTGCRSPSPTVDPFVPYGPQRVPPPATGTLGTPAPQPAAPYYQNQNGSGQSGSGTRTAPAPNSTGWHPPSTNLGTQSLTQSQPSNTNANATNVANSGATPPNANYTSTGGQQYNAAPRVTNPATIQRHSTIQGQTGAGGQGQTGGGSPAGNAVFGSGTRSAQTQPWQPSGGVGSPQLLRTNAPPSAPPAVPSNVAPGAASGQSDGAVGSAINNTLGINVGGQRSNGAQPTTGQPGGQGQPVNNGWNQQPNNGWSQPPVNNGSQAPTAPGGWSPNGMQLNGMPVNDATSAYPVSSSPWSMAGVRNWFRTQFGQPTYATPAVYGGQPAYPSQAAYQAQTTPATGYSTSAPVPNPLPMRGMQQNAAPASYPVQQRAAAPTAPMAPAAKQWGSVPMAHAATPTTTVRGNDDGASSATGFVTSRQASPTPHEADLFGAHAQYRWLRGRLEYSATKRHWKLRYIPHDAPEGRMDSFGGSVVLAIDEGQLADFESGDFVMVKGQLGKTNADGSTIDPLYNVDSVAKL